VLYIKGILGVLE